MKTVKKYLESLGYSRLTIESYYVDILKYISWCDRQKIEITEASHNEIMGYIQVLKTKGLSQRSIDHEVRSIRHYYDWLIRKEIRSDNPAKQISIKGIKKKVLYEILSHSELESIYHSYNDGSLRGKRNKVIMGLMIYQGLHGGEINHLDIKDVHLREAKIYISGSRRSNERTLDIKAHQIMDFMEYVLQVRVQLLQLSGKQTDRLIVSSGKSLTAKNTLTKVLKHIKGIQPKITTLKQIRASVITHWLKQYNLREVQYRAGHRYVSSTESYQINDMEGMKDAIALFHPDND